MGNIAGDINMVENVPLFSDGFLFGKFINVCFVPEITRNVLLHT